MIPWWIGLILFIAGAMVGIMLLALVSANKEGGE